MSTKKTTTTAKAPAKPAAKAPDKKSPIAVKPAKDVKPIGKPAPKAELTPFQKLFEGLPTNPKECSAEQVQTLNLRYKEVKATLPTEEQAKVREYGLAASAAVKAAASKKPEADGVTDKEIKALIEEMNTVMDLEPLIVFGEDHMGRITSEAKDLRPADFDSTSDKCFTLAARATFRKLGIALPGDKAAAKAAKAAAPKVPGEKKVLSGAGRSPYGHQLTSQAGCIDTALAKGGTLEQLVAASGASAGRVTVHMNHLKKDHSVTVEKSDKGVYKIV